MLDDGAGSKQTDGNEAKFNWYTWTLYLILKHNFTNTSKDGSSYMKGKGQTYQS